MNAKQMKQKIEGTEATRGITVWVNERHNQVQVYGFQLGGEK